MNQQTPLTIDSITADIYPALAQLDAVHNEPWDEALFASRMASPTMMGYAAKLDGDIAGYIVYQHDDTHHQNSVFKFVVNPAYEARAGEIQEALLDSVKKDMSADGRSHIVIYSTEGEDTTLGFFKNGHKEFRQYKAHGADQVMLIYEMPDATHATRYPDLPPSGIDKPNGGNNGSPTNFLDTSQFMSGQFVGIGIPDTAGNVTIINAPSYDNGITIEGGFNSGMTSDTAQNQPPLSAGFEPYSINTSQVDNIDQTYDYLSNADADAPSTPAPRKLSPVMLLAKARAKLTELTGMEWEIARMTPKGSFETVSLNTLPEGESLYLRSGSKIASPAAALTALYDFLGEKPPKGHAQRLSQSAQIVIPASYVRPIHLDLGSPGKLQSAFTPAATQMRYQCQDELDEQQQKKAGGLPGR
jgi:hypothetical protein